MPRRVPTDPAARAKFWTEWRQQVRDAKARAKPTIAEYDARRCFVCGSNWAWFGFAPPGAPPSATRWACLEHQDQL